MGLWLILGAYLLSLMTVMFVAMCAMNDGRWFWQKKKPSWGFHEKVKEDPYISVGGQSVLFHTSVRVRLSKDKKTSERVNKDSPFYNCDLSALPSFDEDEDKL